MSKPKERQRQFAEERKTKLKLRDNQNTPSGAKKSSPKVEKESPKKPIDAQEGKAISGNHAEQIREYRYRQRDKVKGIKGPGALNEQSRNPKNPQEDENGG